MYSSSSSFDLMCLYSKSSILAFKSRIVPLSFSFTLRRRSTSFSELPVAVPPLPSFLRLTFLSEALTLTTPFTGNTPKFLFFTSGVDALSRGVPSAKSTPCIRAAEVIMDPSLCTVSAALLSIEAFEALRSSSLILLAAPRLSRFPLLSTLPLRPWLPPLSLRGRSILTLYTSVLPCPISFFWSSFRRFSPSVLVHEPILQCFL
mmetsp:Transcript_14976/g.26936  ORF Transcript_14976/g.26936 Transcript_14976/m.26936 type:complete len:204 (+) Transcript_14976:1569-2180(+)